MYNVYDIHLSTKINNVHVIGNITTMNNALCAHLVSQN